MPTNYVEYLRSAEEDDEIFHQSALVLGEDRFRFRLFIEGTVFHSRRSGREPSKRTSLAKAAAYLGLVRRNRIGQSGTQTPRGGCIWLLRLRAQCKIP